MCLGEGGQYDCGPAWVSLGSFNVTKSEPMTVHMTLENHVEQTYVEFMASVRVCEMCKDVSKA